MNLSDDEIVVVAKYSGNLTWYVSDRDYWVLDWSAWRKAFVDAGYEVPDPGYADRFGIAVVHKDNAGDFMSYMDRFKCDPKALHLARTVDGELSLPELLVDFDACRIVVGAVESPRFERYLPSGWTASFEGVLDHIPDVDRYWRQ